MCTKSQPVCDHPFRNVFLFIVTLSFQIYKDVIAYQVPVSSENAVG